MTANQHRAGFVFIIVLCLFSRAQAVAADCQKPAVPLSALLMPPPRQGSAETNAELRELQRLDKSRTAQQVKHASSDHEQSLGRFLGEIGIKVGTLPRFADHFFTCIANIAEDQTAQAKQFFKRLRPYKLPHNGLHPLKRIGDFDSPSYPSGHATYGTIIGLVLAEMLPEKKQEIFKRIEDYGYSRMVSSVHFRSDVYAGEVAGGAIAARLFMNAVFRDDFQQAKNELRKAIGYPP
jgi:acid phosphatase (class A)